MKPGSFVLVVLLLVGGLKDGVSSSIGVKAASARQSAVVNFAAPVEVNGKIVIGKYLIVHDANKMASGEPCSFLYAWRSNTGAEGTPTVSFHCQPVHRQACDKTTLTTAFDWAARMYKVVEYQFAGETEGHAIPEPPVPSN